MLHIDIPRNSYECQSESSISRLQHVERSADNFARNNAIAHGYQESAVTLINNALRNTPGSLRRQNSAAFLNTSITEVPMSLYTTVPPFPR